jgi:hypothetical protein
MAGAGRESLDSASLLLSCGGAQGGAHIQPVAPRINTVFNIGLWVVGIE